MSETLPNYTRTNYPDALDTFSYKQDVTADKKSDVEQYYTYINSGNFTAATAMIESDATLRSMIVGCEDFNKLIDAIKAMQYQEKYNIDNYIATVVKNKGNYSSSTQYTRYNVVIYNNLPYMCMPNNDNLTAPIGTLPTDTNYWYALAIKGDKGASGLGLTPRGVWDVSTKYYQYDMIAYNNTLWSCENTCTGITPSESAVSYWSKLLTFDSNILTFNNTTSDLTSSSLQDAIVEVNEKVNNHEDSFVQPINLGGTGSTTKVQARMSLEVPFGGYKTLTSSDTILSWASNLYGTGQAMTIDTSGYPSDTPIEKEGSIIAIKANSLRSCVFFIVYVKGVKKIFERHIYNGAWLESSWIDLFSYAETAGALTSTLSVSGGGTGATNAATARANLGVSYGTSAGTVCQGNDSRLSDARNPKSHSQAASTITSGTFNGDVAVPATSNYTGALCRNGVFLPKSSDPGKGSSSSYPIGTIVYIYEE